MLSVPWCTLRIMDTAVLIALLAGLTVGALLAWLLARAGRRAAVAESRRDADAARATAESELTAARRDRDAEADRARQAEQRAEQATERTTEVQVELASVRASLDAERAAGQERQRREAEVTERLKDSFQALSAEALSRNNESFVQLAEARIKEATAALQAKADGDATNRQQAIESMLNPVSQTLHRVEGQLRTVEKEREAAYAGLREQVGAMHRTSEQLHTETRQLVTALRAPQVRGRWGELQLERIVQLAGMVEHCDFDKQVSVTDSSGDADAVVRPDLVVHLAGDKQIVLDAKVPFAAYLEATDATDPDRRAERLAAHARQLRTHVDQLAGKSYWQRFESTPEFVVLFVPGDPFLEAALQSDPALLEHAFERNVVVATPTTLIALLRTVGYTWRQEALARNAAQVHALGRELHSRLATMGGHVAKLGRQLTGAVDSYNRTVSSLESRVLVTARRFADLEVVERDLETPEQIERSTRTVAATELSETCSQGRGIDTETCSQGRGIDTDSLIVLEHRSDPDRYGIAGGASRRQDEDPGRFTVSG